MKNKFKENVKISFINRKNIRITINFSLVLLNYFVSCTDVNKP